MKQKVKELKEKIEKECPQFSEKACVIQACGEICEKDSFIDSFLLCKENNTDYGVLWVNKEIDYIPANILEILGENGMNVKMKNYRKSNQIRFE